MSRDKKLFVCVTGCEKFAVEKDIIKLFRKLLSSELTVGIELPVKAVAKKRGANFAFLDFEDADQRKKFIEMFTSIIMPQKRMNLRDAFGVNEKHFKPVREKQLVIQEHRDRLIQQVEALTHEDIIDALKETVVQKVTPLALIKYEDQLGQKQKWLEGVLQSFITGLKSEIEKGNEHPPSWFRANPVIELEPQAICSEQIDGYRNKVEFTVGMRYDVKSKSAHEVCVGFNVGNSSKGINFVDLPDQISVNSSESLTAAKKFEQIVQSSGIQPFNKNTNSGLWRILLYRESVKTKQILISFVVTDGLEISQDLKTKLVESFQEPIGDRRVVSISIIYSNDISGGYKDVDRLELLFGNEYYEEKIFGITFRVSPFAFFQVNTPVFEKMLIKVKEFAQIDQETTLLDICCGTGAIGLCLSQTGCKKVIGVELIKQAVENANENVKLNSQIFEGREIEFHAGRAEDLLPSLVENQSGKIIGIVDPPRSGLHQNVLKVLRTCKGLDRLVYVSCNALTQVQDLKYLCYEVKGKRKGPPFRPVRAVGADLFPHTSHIESIVLLERSYD